MDLYEVGQKCKIWNINITNAKYSNNKNKIDFYIRNFKSINYLQADGRTVYLHMNLQDLNLILFDVKTMKTLDQIAISPGEFSWNGSALSNLTSYVDTTNGEIWFQQFDHIIGKKFQNSAFKTGRTYLNQRLTTRGQVSNTIWHDWSKVSLTTDELKVKVTDLEKDIENYKFLLSNLTN